MPGPCVLRWLLGNATQTRSLGLVKFGAIDDREGDCTLSRAGACGPTFLEVNILAEGD